jgi:putative salt-induced outer membrane protein YdiY
MTRILIFALLLSTVARAGDPKYEYGDATKSPDVKKPTVWKANMTLGLTWIDGNAQSIGFSATGLTSVKHWNNEFTFNVGGAYVYGGFSQKYGTGGPVDNKKQTAGNWLWKLRYDRYFLEKNTIFTYFQMSGDEFAGFLRRYEAQIGYARLFWQSVHQTFKGEIGYDYMHEFRVEPASCTERPCRVFNYHNARLFLFYENKFTPYASFSEGLEMLEAFNRPEAFRLNSLTTLSSSISKNFALKVNFRLAFNNDPPARPTPTNIDPTTMKPFVYGPDQSHFDKVDTQLDVVLAVTVL